MVIEYVYNLIVYETNATGILFVYYFRNDGFAQINLLHLLSPNLQDSIHSVWFSFNKSQSGNILRFEVNFFLYNFTNFCIGFYVFTQFLFPIVEYQHSTPYL